MSTLEAAIDVLNGHSDALGQQLAEGFLTLEDECDVHYHMGATYRPEASRGLRWDDPTIAIDWPDSPTLISEHDAGYPNLDPATFDLSH